ncbi:hypothetical protein SELMODRAFT_423480 [Selaginella moellendorffii]|uniref:Uncharacterized protein n=1 Tax=Selaginella moellendorffii TaxID=88036 RepID=D8SLU8_SELML|nr:hypothetical protein SELMODRAFT_423480 [Selaginella moellendorffii]
MASVWLWLQFSYAVWQFLREAKFFRIPSALIYHTFKWLTDPIFGPPFSTATFGLVVQGQKWTYPMTVEHQLDSSDTRLGNSAHFLQRRRGTAYIVDYSAICSSYILKRHGTQFICSKVDHLLPQLCIADAFAWGEGFDLFMAEGATIETFTKRVLLMSSREHFLNKDFTRLLSLLPLMLDANGYGVASRFASVGIIALDLLSYPANRMWMAMKDVMVGCARLWISRIAKFTHRDFVTTFLCTISPRLRLCDQVVRNFYYVRKGEGVLVFGTCCADYFYPDLTALEEPEARELNPFMKLSSDDIDSLNGAHEGQFEEKFGISNGWDYVEHRIGEATIKTVFVQNHGAFYNFIDNGHLHYGRCVSDDEQRRVRVALKWIENNGRMPDLQP